MKGISPSNKNGLLVLLFAARILLLGEFSQPPTARDAMFINFTLPGDVFVYLFRISRRAKRAPSTRQKNQKTTARQSHRHRHRQLAYEIIARSVRFYCQPKVWLHNGMGSGCINFALVAFFRSAEHFTVAFSRWLAVKSCVRFGLKRGAPARNTLSSRVGLSARFEDDRKKEVPCKMSDNVCDRGDVPLRCPIRFG